MTLLSPCPCPDIKLNFVKVNLKSKLEMCRKVLNCINLKIIKIKIIKNLFFNISVGHHAGRTHENQSKRSKTNMRSESQEVLQEVLLGRSV